MARLVINPGAPTVSEVQLKPGANSIGRGPDNDVKLLDGSVSGSHCQILLNEHGAVLKDLGSTNGTFVNRTPVQEAELQNGQTLHLGGVPMIFLSEEADLIPAPPPPRPALASPSAPVRFSEPPRGGEPALDTLSPPPLAPPIMPRPDAAPPALIAGKCKHHPKTFGRFFCSHCKSFFCELCVNSRNPGGVQHKFCRKCGAECSVAQVRFEPVVERSFWQRLPEAFIYPVRGAGVLLTIVGIVLFVLMNCGLACVRFLTFRMVAFGIVIEIAAGGYLFTFLQAIIHATTAGEAEMPDLPGIDSFVEDVLAPFFRLLGLVLVCFVPALALLIWCALTRDGTVALAALAAGAFGCVYFPMAFLAVAVMDSFLAINPLLVVPSIIKVPLEYLTVLFLLGCTLAIRSAGNVLALKLFPQGFATGSMGTLFGLLGTISVFSFLTLYLVLVAVHMLGVVFVTNKNRLGWLERRG